MSNKQTAVEWLENILHDFIHPEHGAEFFPFIEQAKQMEKEQIMNAVYFGHLKEWVDGGVENSFGEQYYKETYGKTA